jgi:hypothetical protein
MFVQSASLSTDTTTVCADIGGSVPSTFNTFAGVATGGVTDIGFKRLSTATQAHLKLPGFTGDGTSNAAIASYLAGRNNGTPSVTNYSGALEGQAGGCQQPSPPVAP